MASTTHDTERSASDTDHSTSSTASITVSAPKTPPPEESSYPNGASAFTLRVQTENNATPVAEQLRAVGMLPSYDARRKEFYKARDQAFLSSQQFFSECQGNNVSHSSTQSFLDDTTSFVEAFRSLQEVLSVVDASLVIDEPPIPSPPVLQSFHDMFGSAAEAIERTLRD